MKVEKLTDIVKLLEECQNVNVENECECFETMDDGNVMMNIIKEIDFLFLIKFLYYFLLKRIFVIFIFRCFNQLIFFHL